MLLWQRYFSHSTFLFTCLTTQFRPTDLRYTPDWNSLDTRPLPQWYDESKFGIFMHWGVYAVPSYTEWFWWNWKGVGDRDVNAFMDKNYRPGFTYAEFGPKFTAEFFDATTFAQIVKSSGARYFVLTSKHHDGYTMYPSNFSWNWNSFDVGPHRDITGELSGAIRKAGLHFGLYYSLFEWFHPVYLADKASTFSTNDYVKTVVAPQLREIINNYKPEVLWSDGDWETSWQYWNTTEFLAWLYNDSPVSETVVTNDRWGTGTLCKHGDFYTCSDRYNPGRLLSHKWENCMTVDKDSWGYRRKARSNDYYSVNELISILAETISCGGNLLLNVGPTHDGRIIPIMEERLANLGVFVNVNEEAIFGTKPWIYQNDTLRPDVWYTSRVRNELLAMYDSRLPYNLQKQSDTIVYAFVLKWPYNNTSTLSLGAPKASSDTKISLLGYEESVRYSTDPESGRLTIDMTSIQWVKMPYFGITTCFVLKFESLKTEKRKPLTFSPKIEGSRSYNRKQRKLQD